MIKWIPRSLPLTAKPHAFIISGYSRAHASDSIGLLKFYGEINPAIMIMVRQMLDVETNEELHNDTCRITRLDKWSKTGDNYIAKKILYAKIKVELLEVKLIDDKPQKEPPKENLTIQRIFDK
jgi:hypothetical protein